MSKRIIRRLTLLLICIPAVAAGQACSCGGAPIVGSLELPQTQAGGWQFGLTYEHNSIADVYSENQKLKNDSRERYVNSAIFEAGYGLTDRFSIAALFALVRQERISGLSTGNGENLTTSGISDAVICLNTTYCHTRSLPTGSLLSEAVLSYRWASQISKIRAA